MEILKRKILLEQSTDRTYNSPNWGSLSADTFFINVFITQNMDDMGLFTDIDFISANTFNNSVDYTILTTKLELNGFIFPFMTGATVTNMTEITGTTQIILREPSKIESDYYNFGNSQISAYTDSKITELKSYDNNERYKVGFNIDTASYVNYNNTQINGVSRVVSLNNPNIYVIDAANNINIGTQNQNTGLRYLDFSASTRNVIINGNKFSIPLTTVNYIGEGWNETNVSLSALTKEEYLFGIISKPEIESDVFIDRGVTSVLEMHLRLSEINNLGKLSRYGNGFYNINKI